jgi:membrane protein implicated in regulation of membrane protease activity
MLTPLDARRRWFGACFLIIAGLMLAWGMTLLTAFLVERPVVFILYWMACFGFTLLAFVTAIIDMRVMRQRTRIEQQKLFEKSFTDSDSKAKSEDR